ncbi:CpaD family pilus assembly lipoprotein [Dongia soli]|uniref:CpaD family pilus assembly lipoprotein n=1 Tax=Dongia soli TaxID=600628 RepID=A0ABU5EB65_9PROT|nr:CpaD family pilus assembly lipoprotein [Dongia soli]MDY0883294.1 CpaD family pilus assembly lipoprotein [Dongia soli]
MRHPIRNVMMLGGLLMISACGTEPYSLYDPHAAFPTTATRRTAYLDVAPFQQQIPAATDSGRLQEFLAAYRQNGEAPIAVTSTAPHVSDPMAQREARDIAIWLQSQGVPAGDIRLYVMESPVAAGPQLTFPMYTVAQRECGYWNSAITNDHDSANTDNFGCATQKNVDAMTANPRDLLMPSTATGRDGARAWKIVDNYQQGKPIPGANDIKQDVNYSLGTTQSSGGGQ